MKTSVIEVNDMLSVWRLEEVEKRIGQVPGVESVTVNFAAKSATVRYDETRLVVADIKSAVRHSGHESPGESPPTPKAESASASAPAARTARRHHVGPYARRRGWSDRRRARPDLYAPFKAKPKPDAHLHRTRRWKGTGMILERELVSDGYSLQL